MKDLMLVVLAYDTPSDERRRRLSRLLEDVGERVQYSVFECWLSEAQFAALWSRLEQTLDRDEDRLRAWRVCTYCRAASRFSGQAQSTGIPQFWMI